MYIAYDMCAREAIVAWSEMEINVCEMFSFYYEPIKVELVLLFISCYSRIQDDMYNGIPYISMDLWFKM